MGIKEVFAFVFFALMALGIFGASHLSDGGSLWSEGEDIDTVVIGSEGLETVSERYTPETERAWCLYGGVEGIRR